MGEGHLREMTRAGTGQVPIDTLAPATGEVARILPNHARSKSNLFENVAPMRGGRPMPLSSMRAAR